MFDIFKKKQLEFLSPIDGEVFPLAETPDIAFAQGMMGDGICILPQNNIICMPFDGTIDIFHTLHAIMLMSQGVEALIHVGMNTVELKGQGFKVLVPLQGEYKAGTPLLELDINFLKSKTSTLMTPLIIVEKPNKSKLEIIRDSGNVHTGDLLMKVTL